MRMLYGSLAPLAIRWSLRAVPDGVVGVLEQVEGRFDAAGAEVDGHHQLGAGELAPAREFVHAHLVGFERVPGEVAADGPLLARAHAVFPAVAGDEVPAGVADGAGAELLDEFDDVEPEAVLVGGGVARLVDAVVDAAAQVFHEGAENAAADRGDDGGAVDGDDGGCLDGHLVMWERLRWW